MHYYNLDDYGNVHVSTAVDFHPDHILDGAPRDDAINQLLDAIASANLTAIVRAYQRAVAPIDDAAAGGDVPVIAEQRQSGDLDRLHNAVIDALAANVSDDGVEWDAYIAACNALRAALNRNS